MKFLLILDEDLSRILLLVFYQAVNWLWSCTNLSLSTSQFIFHTIEQSQSFLVSYPHPCPNIFYRFYYVYKARHHRGSSFLVRVSNMVRFVRKFHLTNFKLKPIAARLSKDSVLFNSHIPSLEECMNGLRLAFDLKPTNDHYSFIQYYAGNQLSLAGNNIFLTEEDVEPSGNDRMDLDEDEDKDEDQDRDASMCRLSCQVALKHGWLLGPRWGHRRGHGWGHRRGHWRGHRRGYGCGRNDHPPVVLCW